MTVIPLFGLGILGLFFGLILGFAAKVFHVEVDERVERINEVLPQANCGACGYPGCSGFAEAVVNGTAEVNACIPGGEDTVHKIAEIMGVKATVGEKKVAFLKCKGTCMDTKYKYEYNGAIDCKAAVLVSNGDKSCEYGCLGYGTCASVCPFDAIHINKETGLPEIDKDKCTACGKCVEECPRDVLDIIPMNSKVFVSCNSQDKGAVVKKVCERGCIGCRICEKVCPFDAIKVSNNIAYIDYSLCRECNLCVEKCPVKVIDSKVIKKNKAYIDEDLCIGCTICKKMCPVDAIEGELKQNHKVIYEKCIGCGVCAEKCPKKAIEMKDM